MDKLDIALDGSDQHTYTLKDFKGQKVVLYFYPKDSTSGCTIEAKEFSDLKTAFEKKNTIILGVSRDSVKSHRRFIENAGLNILLLSDKDELLSNAFDVIGEKKLYGKTFKGIIRSTFVLDENGKLIKSYRNIKPKGHALQVLNDLSVD